MEIRRPLAALLTALALFGGGATLTSCGDPAGQDRNDGTTDDTGNQTGGATETSEPSETSESNLPDNSNQEENEDDGSGADVGND
ncbi:hypothetical protein [Geodermatophilus sp. SYSU D00815]